MAEMPSYNIIKSPGEGEYIDKKSRFIGYACPIAGEEEALAIIDQIKRRYWDARHNCYAYVTGERGDILRFSDDGEPGGTAGRPILDVITGAGLRDALIVVTRYFGGTLLGTGGLVRAYTESSKLAIESADIRQMVFASKIQITADYTAVGKLQYFFAQQNIVIDDTQYTDAVSMIVNVEQTRVTDICDNLTQLTAGKGEINILDTGYYPI